MNNIGAHSVEMLKIIMKALRDPDSGCAWDKVQTFESIAPYAIEEAYEVVDAIERNNLNDLQDELGDLLLQVIFHSQMADEQGAFDFNDVVASICDKMIRRHPHVFSDGTLTTADDVKMAWEERKALEREAKDQTGVLSDVPVVLPALTRAVKLTKRAARVGFDWPNIQGVLAKLQEEIAELQDELTAPEIDQVRVQEEYGDVLFCVANVGRHLKVDPEQALRKTNTKFSTRFSYVEQQVEQQGGDWAAFELNALDTWWNEAKQNEQK